MHPIPPDGLYTSWDHNHDTVARYYNEQQQTTGYPIDGRNDDVGQIDEIPLPDPIGTQPAYFDVTDPTFQRPLAIYNWEQVAGKSGNGSVVYLFQMNNVQGAENPTIIPYYRDDACFDDGTGDDAGRTDIVGSHPTAFGDDFDGVLRTARNLRVEGQAKGEVYCDGTLLVEEGGQVDARVVSANITVAARRLPVHLLFPLVLCTLPAFGLLTVAPLLAGGLRSLRL